MLRGSIIVPWLILWASIGTQAAETAPAKDSAGSIDTRTVSMRHLQGLLPRHWDAKHGHLYLEIPHPGVELLYVDSLPSGVGSTELGLDRRQSSELRVVRFERLGAKVLLVQTNDAFRSSAPELAERLAVRESFPESVLAGFSIEAEGSQGALLVDATEFFLRDVHDVPTALGKQGAYRLDEKRSAIAIDDRRVFPKHTEVESVLTFISDAPLAHSAVAEVAPVPAPVGMPIGDDGE